MSAPDPRDTEARYAYERILARQSHAAFWAAIEKRKQTPLAVAHDRAEKAVLRLCAAVDERKGLLRR